MVLRAAIFMPRRVADVELHFDRVWSIAIYTHAIVIG